MHPRRRRSPVWCFAALSLLGVIAVAGSRGGDTAPLTFEQKLEVRVDKIVDGLQLDDPIQKTRAHDLLLARYRDLNAWHAAHDADVKTLRKAVARHEPDAEQKLAVIDASLTTLHQDFLQRLGAVLSSAQVEAVKDAMTYHKVKVTYDAYCEIVPGLKDVDKDRILDFLKQAREEAIDAGSAEEKSAVFGRYKGKINNYLSSAGYNVKQAFQDWGARHTPKPPANAEK